MLRIGRKVELKPVLAQCGVIEALEPVLVLGNRPGQAKVEGLKIAIVVQDVIGYNAFVIEDLTDFDPLVLLGKALLDEVIDRHQSLLSIYYEKFVSLLFVEKELRYRKVEYQRLYQPGGACHVPDEVALKAGDSHRSGIDEGA